MEHQDKKVDYTQIKNEVRDSLGKYFYKERTSLSLSLFFFNNIESKRNK